MPYTYGVREGRWNILTINGNFNRSIRGIHWWFQYPHILRNEFVGSRKVQVTRQFTIILPVVNQSSGEVGLLVRGAINRLILEKLEEQQSKALPNA